MGRLPSVMCLGVSYCSSFCESFAFALHEPHDADAADQEVTRPLSGMRLKQATCVKLKGWTIGFCQFALECLLAQVSPLLQ